MKNEVLAIPVVFVSLVVFTELIKSIFLEDYHPDESHNACTWGMCSAFSLRSSSSDSWLLRVRTSEYLLILLIQISNKMKYILYHNFLAYLYMRKKV